MLLVTSTCNDCSSDLSYTLESQDSKYSDEQSKIKKKILPPCSWMKVFLWLCCPQWTLLVPAPRGTAAPAFPKSRSIPDLQPPRDTGWSPAGAEVAMDGPLLWAALSQWGLDPSPQQEQGGDLRLWCLSAHIVIPWCKTKVTEQGIMQRCLVFSSLCVTAGQMETSWVI